jgi:hypothetical protein
MGYGGQASIASSENSLAGAQDMASSSAETKGTDMALDVENLDLDQCLGR